jgi:hypothetical protein
LFVHTASQTGTRPLGWGFETPEFRREHRSSQDGSDTAAAVVEIEKINEMRLTRECQRVGDHDNRFVCDPLRGGTPELYDGVPRGEHNETDEVRNNAVF